MKITYLYKRKIWCGICKTETEREIKDRENPTSHNLCRGCGYIFKFLDAATGGGYQSIHIHYLDKLDNPRTEISRLFKKHGYTKEDIGKRVIVDAHFGARYGGGYWIYAISREEN